MRLSPLVCAVCITALLCITGMGCPAQKPQEQAPSEQPKDAPVSEKKAEAATEPAPPERAEPTTEPRLEPKTETIDEPGPPDASEPQPEPRTEPTPEPTPEPDAGGDGTTPESSDKICSFNTDCPSQERCECDENTGCFCKVGVRGTGQNGVDTCTTGNDCASALCVEGNGGIYYCSGECSSDSDCKEKLPVCAQISLVGQICIRQKN